MCACCQILHGTRHRGMGPEACSSHSGREHSHMHPSPVSGALRYLWPFDVVCTRSVAGYVRGAKAETCTCRAHLEPTDAHLFCHLLCTQALRQHLANFPLLLRCGRRKGLCLLVFRHCDRLSLNRVLPIMRCASCLFPAPSLELGGYYCWLDLFWRGGGTGL